MNREINASSHPGKEGNKLYKSKLIRDTLISITGYIVLLTTSFAYRYPLFNYSVEIIPQMQE